MERRQGFGHWQRSEGVGRKASGVGAGEGVGSRIIQGSPMRGTRSELGPKSGTIPALRSGNEWR